MAVWRVRLTRERRAATGTFDAVVQDRIGGGGDAPKPYHTRTYDGGDETAERGKPLGSRRALRSAPTAVERTNRSYAHRVRQTVTPSTMAPFTNPGSATGGSRPGIQIVSGRWTRQTSPKFP